MNHREPRLRPRDSAQAWRYLAMLLLPLLDPAHSNAAGRMRSTNRFPSNPREGPTPYLQAANAPPLRFQEPPPAPPAIVRPLRGVPFPTYRGMNDVSAPDVIVHNPRPAVPPPAEPANEIKEAPPPPRKSSPAPILPDDVRPQTRPEDILPFFQLPGSRRGPIETSVIVPVPASAPSPAPIPPPTTRLRDDPSPPAAAKFDRLDRRSGAFRSVRKHPEPGPS